MYDLTVSFIGAIFASIAITVRDGQRTLFGRIQVETPGRQVWQPQRLLDYRAGDANREVVKACKELAEFFDSAPSDLFASFENEHYIPLSLGNRKYWEWALDKRISKVHA